MASDYELDVHGLQAAQAIRAVEEAYAQALRQGVDLRIVHGYLHGTVLRRRIQAFLAEHGEALVVGEELGNPGVTRVVPRRPLPVRAASLPLFEALLDYCATARTMDKIVARLVRRYPEPELRAALDQLCAQGRLVRRTVKGKTMWSAT
jgi:Smr domain